MYGYFDWEHAASDADALNESITFFQENGYAIFTSFCTSEEVQSLRARAKHIVADFHKPSASSQSSEKASVFTTAHQTRKMDDNYFLASAQNVSCFLEAKQLADGSQPAVNKIGHALHDLDCTFESFSRQEKVRRVADALGVQRAALVQSMYILKNPRIGGEVRPHRDATFVRGSDGKCLGYWWALEDATIDNGCLWAVPGSQKDMGGRRKFVLEDGKTLFKGDVEAEDHIEDERYVALPVKAGDLVMLDGEVIHKSLENTSEKSRHAYSIHVVRDGTPKDCWLQRPVEMPFRAL